MNRIAIFLLFAGIGFAVAFAGAAAPGVAQAGIRKAPPSATAETPPEVPLSWIAEAMAGMPFVLPAGR